MCLLLAYVGTPRALAPWVLDGDASLRKLALEKHQHSGWGVAAWDAKGLPWIRKAAKAAPDDPRFDAAVHELTPARLALVHIRAASVPGSEHPLNTHPWIHKGWVFCHHGTLRGMDPEGWAHARAALPEAARELVRGGTDSERAFAVVLGEMLRAHGTLAVPLEDAADALTAAHNRLMARFPGPADRPSEANFVLGDGTGFAATRWRHPLWLQQGPDFAILATQPVGPAAAWVEVPDRSLVLVRAGGAATVTALPPPTA